MELLINERIKSKKSVYVIGLIKEDYILNIPPDREIEIIELVKKIERILLRQE